MKRFKPTADAKRHLLALLSSGYTLERIAEIEGIPYSTMTNRMYTCFGGYRVAREVVKTHNGDVEKALAALTYIAPVVPQACVQAPQVEETTLNTLLAAILRVEEKLDKVLKSEALVAESTSYSSQGFGGVLQ